MLSGIFFQAMEFTRHVLVHVYRNVFITENYDFLAYSIDFVKSRILLIFVEGCLDLIKFFPMDYFLLEIFCYECMDRLYISRSILDMQNNVSQIIKSDNFILIKRCFPLKLFQFFFNFSGNFSWVVGDLIIR